MLENPKKDETRPKGKISNGLVSASCAAVLAVYAAGYTRTQAAADRFNNQVAERRPSIRQAAPAAPAEVASTTSPEAVAPAAPVREAVPEASKTTPAKSVVPATEK